MNLLTDLFGFERARTRGESIVARVLEAVVVLSALAITWEWSRIIPRIDDVVLPLGLARFIDVSFLYLPGAAVINGAIIAVGLLAGWARLWRGAYAVACIGLLLQYSARYSLGEIPHSTNLLGMLVLGLALASLAYRDQVLRDRFVHGFGLFSAGLGYTLAGASKLVATGPGWVDGRHLWMWIYEKEVDALSKVGEWSLNVFQEAVLAAPALGTLMLTIGLVSEALAFLIWWRRPRPWITLGVAGLHVGIMIMMGIAFKSALAIVLIIGLPWAAWIDRFVPDGSSRPAASP